MVRVITDEMNDLYDSIYANRCSIAELKKLKITARSEAWVDASGIKLAKEKEDFVRSEVAQLQERIDLAEAEIERDYNKVKVLELVHSDE